MRRATAAVMLVLSAIVMAAAALPAQVATATTAAPSPRPAVVVQVAGANLYLNIGADSGVITGDTVAVRRSAAAPPIGSLTVLSATRTRSVLTFAGAPFPVTRGDTLFIMARPRDAVTGMPVPVIAAAARPRAPPVVATGPRVDGAIGFEMYGSHSETVGLGADPLRTTRDIGMPAVRLNTMISGERTRFRLNLRAQQRTGPTSVWDRSTRIRLYEARLERSAGPARITLGRFYSDFDHQSAFWDGASVRFGDGRGVSAGMAAGFEPERGNEEITFTRPKAAAFVGTRHTRGRMDLVTDLAVTQAMPKDRALWQAGADLAVHLRVGRFSLSQDLEAAPPTPMGRWGISRFVLRASLPAGPRGMLYATAVSDRFTPLDTTILAAFTRRERVTTGYSVSLANGTYLDLNASVNDPSGDQRGTAAGATVSVPRAIGAGTFAFHTSWFDDGRGSGLLASPSFEYRLGQSRLRGGYQFYSVTQPAYTMRTHGIDVRLWKPFGDRISGVLQVNERVGENLRSTTVFTSVEVRF